MTKQEMIDKLNSLPEWPWTKNQKLDYIDWSTKALAELLNSPDAPNQPPIHNDFVEKGCEKFHP